MNKIKNLVNQLLVKDENQVEILQKINRLFLEEYMLKIEDNLFIYPIEVEAYYFHDPNFQDTCVHRNELQKTVLENFTFTELQNLGKVNFYTMLEV